MFVLLCMICIRSQNVCTVTLQVINDFQGYIPVLKKIHTIYDMNVFTKWNHPQGNEMTEYYGNLGEVCEDHGCC